MKLDEVHSSTSISTHNSYLQTKIEIAGTQSSNKKWLDEDIKTTMDGIKIDWVGINENKSESGIVVANFETAGVLNRLD